jgi:hypothetical protein
MVARRRSTRLSHMPGPPQTFLFGPAPILKGEDSEAYDALFARISMDVKPTDIIEEIWIRDVADLTWEILRWRKLKIILLEQMEDHDLSYDYSGRHFSSQLEIVERVDRLITIAEGRRNGVLREIDRHRLFLAQMLRDKIRDIEGTKFKTVETKAIAQQDNKAVQRAG